jgi:hypothetical protein
MKSFILAIFLLLSVSLFVFVNAGKTVCRIDEILRIANKLPKTEESFLSADDISNDVFHLIDLWNQEFPKIARTAGYANTNRCDQAIGALAVHFQNRNGNEFAVTLSEFCDGLYRLRTLEGISWEGLF